MSELAEPCSECRAPLVPGQRYCLYCGTRRPEARLEFLDVLAEDRGPAPVAAAPAVTTVTTVREPGVNGWLRQNSPVLALTGLILGTLLVGLLIGHWATGSDDSSAPAARAAAPQVIRVDAGTAAPATTTADTAATDAADTNADSGTAKKKKASSSKQADAAASDDDATAAPAAVSVEDTGSGADQTKAVEQAAKKGQPISTGGDGKLPPTDDKAPAGGTDFETIG